MTTTTATPGPSEQRPSLVHPLPPLSSQIIRTIYLFQAVVAGPTFVCLGIATFFCVWNGSADLYYFTTWLCTSLMAAGIIFTVLIQRKAGEGQISPRLQLLFEVLKSACATGLWVWLIVDSCTDTYLGVPRRRRVVASVMAGVLLLFFYATLGWAIFEYRRGKDTSRKPGREVDEVTPLLREG